MQQLRSAIHNAIARFLKNQPPARIIAVGFALLILLGAALLLLADIAARTVLAPQELATGIMTALVGAPAFIFIASRFLK